MFVFEGHNYDFGPPARDIAIAVSGGPDSMALCWLLDQWATQENTRIHALTVDHGLRPEATAEAAQVGQWLQDWPHTQHVILKLDSAIGETRVMENARAGRYELLASYCRERKIEKLFVAHHQDDQAETFLFRLAKGSGLDGLAAMRREKEYAPDLTIIRPLLDVPKEHLVVLCQSCDIPFVEDPTNDDGHYARPRLRKSYDILATEGLTPKRLAVTAARLARARDALDHYAAQAYHDSIVEKVSSKIILDFEMLKQEPAETRHRVLLLAMEEISPGSGYGPRREKTEELAALLFVPDPFRRRTLGGCIFSRGVHIVIEREK